MRLSTTPRITEQALTRAGTGPQRRGATRPHRAQERRRDSHISIRATGDIPVPGDYDGEPMKEGSIVLINGKHKRIIHFDNDGEITFEDFHPGDIETVEYLSDDRFGALEDSVLDEA